MVEMSSRILFDERVNDIDEYFNFIEFLISKRPLMSYVDDGIQKNSPVSTDTTHILKSNGYLVLYNLIEATISNAIEDIHDTLISDPNVGVDTLCISLAKRALLKFDQPTIGNEDFSSTDVQRLVLESWIKKHKQLLTQHKNPLFSGNVDARKIRDVAVDYGFSHETEGESTDEGRCLYHIRVARNSLAHGANSFKEMGISTSIDELIRFKDETKCYLDQILNNIKAYLEDKKYLKN